MSKSLFTSRREKRLWLWALAVLVAIFSTLFVGRPLLNVLGEQNIQAGIFLLGMLLVGVVILIHGLRSRPGKVEMVTLLGIAAVYIMLFLRLGLPERSHLIEYSVLAIFIHKALLERKIQGKHIPQPALLAILIAFLIGVLDEFIQIFLPDRVFDPTDMLFNGIAVIMAIGASSFLSWVRKRIISS